jgi:hypothetical protein
MYGMNNIKSYQEFVCHIQGSIPQQPTTATRLCPVIMTEDMLMFCLGQTTTTFCHPGFHTHNVRVCSQKHILIILNVNSLEIKNSRIIFHYIHYALPCLKKQGYDLLKLNAAYHP